MEGTEPMRHKIKFGFTEPADILNEQAAWTRPTSVNKQDVFTNAANENITGGEIAAQYLAQSRNLPSWRAQSRN